MTRTISRVALGVVFAGLWAGISFEIAAQDPGPDAAAQKIVAAAGVREGDLVLITGAVRDNELLEQLAVHARKGGAHPLVTLDSERMAVDMFAKVPARYDTQPPAFGIKLAEAATVMINVEFGDDPAAFAGVPPARRVAVGKAGEPIGKTLLSRNVRQVFVGNSLYPTKGNAATYGIPQPELARMFWAGVNVEPGALQTLGNAVKTVLAAGKELRITNANGTDFKVRIDGRPIFISDGVISAEEEKTGGAACSVWLPAGEIYLAPVRGTAEGTLVVDRQMFDGKEIQGLTFAFKAGNLVSMSARSGVDALKAVYDAAGPGKEVFGVVDLGLNPAVKVPPGSRLLNWVPAGMVSVALGNNSWAGGDNTTSFGLSSFLPGSTVTVDGKVVVEAGSLKF